MWFQSRVTVFTSPDTATSQETCSSPNTPPLAGRDFCQLRQEVVFPVGVVSQHVTVQLLDDEVAEGEESFLVQLLEGEGLSKAILHGNLRTRVTITDTEDCESIYY